MIEPSFRTRPVSAEDAVALSAALTDILIDCVHGGASVSFMAPLARPKAEAFWRGVAEGVGRGERRLIVAEEAADGLVIGTAQLLLEQPENQPHRADVSKVLVHPGARRRGVGAALMRAVEVAAREAGKTLLVLDTVTGLDGDRLYERSGWMRVGVIPGYALMPDGQVCDTCYFYKQLGQ